MADVTISSTGVDHEGVENPTTTSVTSTDTFYVRNSGNILLFFENAGNAAATVTLDITRKYAGIADVTDPTFTVPALASSVNGRTYVGPFSRAFNDTDGDIRFTSSAALTVTVLRL